MSRITGAESLVGLTAFARAAGAGSYTAAARLLGLSPSAVSKSVQRLEARLGVRLFNRTTRSLGLTPEGQDLYERCLRLLREVDSIEAAAAVARSVPSGRLVVAAPSALGRLVVAPALGRFRALHPAVDLELRLSDRLVDPVQDGVDVAIRIGELADTRLVSRRLAPHRAMACASPDYLARRGWPERPNDLFAHDCLDLRFANSGRLFRWPFLVGGTRVELALPGVMVADDGEAVAILAAAGLGVACVASYIADAHIRAGRLVPLLAAYAVEEAPISAVYPDTRRSSPAVRAFVAFAAELIPPRPAWDDAARHGAARE